MATKAEVLEAVRYGRGRLGQAGLDEPVFILRAPDKLAPRVVVRWAPLAEQAGAPQDEVHGASQAKGGLARNPQAQRHGTGLINSIGGQDSQHSNQAARGCGAFHADARAARSINPVPSCWVVRKRRIQKEKSCGQTSSMFGSRRAHGCFVIGRLYPLHIGRGAGLKSVCGGSLEAQ